MTQLLRIHRNSCLDLLLISVRMILIRLQRLCAVLPKKQFGIAQYDRNIISSGEFNKSSCQLIVKPLFDIRQLSIFSVKKCLTLIQRPPNQICSYFDQIRI